MTTKHTPGPWTLDLTGKGLRGADGHAVFDDYADRSNAETLANARLIASAPDLLAALESARDWIVYNDESGDPPDILSELEAALRKARVF